MGIYPLQDGEQLLWSGAPQRRQRWFYEHYVMVLGSAALICFVGFWIAVDDSIKGFLIAWPMLTVLFIAQGQQLQTRRARALATTYLVTDQRIIYVAQWPTGAEYRWVRLVRLPPARVKAGEDGVGTITFGTSWWTRGRLAQKEHLGAWAPFVPELRAIADAPRVADLIRQASHRIPPVGR
ncbi:hypothetical protein [Amycolatopsis sp. cmx-4-68]|uniref:hypothetical protein n=1 Tax=Amycolatopsis sp. cmx-4-68 TaxID=2790938 RepID=UPI003978EFE1